MTSTIRPMIDGTLVEHIGEIGDAEKADFLSGAKALLLPIDWPEPFGLVMIEAMACGTPVIAFSAGSVPEIIEDGVTGFVVSNMAEACEAVLAAAGTVARGDPGALRTAVHRRADGGGLCRAVPAAGGATSPGAAGGYLIGLAAGCGRGQVRGTLGTRHRSTSAGPRTLRQDRGWGACAP